MERKQNGIRMRRVIGETFIVAVLGVLAALAANFISPRGLSLTRNYFPAAGAPVRGAPVANPAGDTVPVGPGRGGATTPAVVVTQPKAGIATLTTAQALELFRDPQYGQELIVFVDARDDRHYAAGHIPGAYQLDRYYPQNHLPTVLPACLNALRVVVYCTGGDCEDSHFAAQLLQEAGIPPERLFVYTGGMTEWDARRLPIETGARKSGSLQ